MLDIIYWFLGGENKDPMWYSASDGGLDGMIIGFSWMVGISFVVSAFFYFFICRKVEYALRRNWILFGGINMIAVAVFLWFIIANVSQQPTLIDGLCYDRIGVFSFLNGLIYAPIFYFISSILFKRFSKFAIYIPF